MAVTLGAFFKRGTKLGLTFSHIEDWSRYILISTLILTRLSSLMGKGPFAGGEGQKWYASKILILGPLMVIGVILRLIVHEWRAIFPELAKGPNAPLEAKLDKSIRLGRGAAYLYWIGILTNGFLAAVKPF